MQSGRSTSRNMIIEDAIEAYIQDAMQIFEEEGIAIETKNIEDEIYDTVVFPAHEDGLQNAQVVYAGLTYGRNTLTENMADQSMNRGMLV